MIIIEVTYNTVYPSIEVTYDTTSVDVISTLSSSPVTIELDYSAVTIADLNLRVPYTGATGDVNLGEHGLTTGQVAFDLTPTGSAGVGVMKWNDAAGTVDLGLKGGNVTMQVGEDMVIRVVNKTGTNLLKSQYKVVRISSAQGQRLAVDFAQANNDNNSADTLGIVAENIDNNQEGFIQVMGQVGSLNTTGSIQGETWNDGDVLYLSPTVSGSITNVKPVAPQHIVVIGYIEYAHQNNGKIYVKVMNGWELGELHDVDTTGAVNGQVLKYNGTIWTPATDAGGISSITAASPLTGGTITTIGTIGINKATAIVDGYLSATDFSTFNSKQNTITLTTTGSSGAATLIGDTLNVPQYADQYVGTVTSVAALTLGTTGTDLSSSVANGTTTPVITLNVPTASATNRGALSSTDWTTFNNKVGGTGVSGQVSYWSGTNTQAGSNNLFWDNANGRLGIGINTPSRNLHIHTPSTGLVSLQLTNTTSGTTLTDGFQVYGDGTNYVFGNFENGYAAYLTNATERMRIHAGGNITIGGITDSGQRLQVIGSARIGSTAASAMYWDDTNSRLGIGTNAPTDILDIRKNQVTTTVATTTSVLLSNTNASGIAAYVFTSDGTTRQGGLQYNNTTGQRNLFSCTYTDIPYYFGTNNLIRLTITGSTGNVLINTTTDGGQRLQVQGTTLLNGVTTVGDNLTVSKNQNGITSATISNTTDGNLSESRIYITSNSGAGTLSIGKYATSKTAYKTILGKDVFIYNTSVGGDISILNDFATGKIKFAAGGSSTVQMEIAASGATTFSNNVTVNGVFNETVTTNRQTASYTLALADRGKLVEMNVATANDLTVPLNSSVAFPVGTKIDIVQYGAGQTTVVATAGVTVNSTNTWKKINAQYGAATLVKIATDEWYLFGNLNA